METANALEMEKEFIQQLRAGSFCIVLYVKRILRAASHSMTSFVVCSRGWFRLA